MKAVRFHQTGGPEVLVFEDVPDPTPALVWNPRSKSPVAYVTADWASGAASSTPAVRTPAASGCFKAGGLQNKERTDGFMM